MNRRGFFGLLGACVAARFAPNVETPSPRVITISGTSAVTITLPEPTYVTTGSNIVVGTNDLAMHRFLESTRFCDKVTMQ